MMVVGSLEIQMLADLGRIKSDMDKAKTLIGSTMGNIEQRVASASRALAGLGLGLSAGAVGYWIRSMVDAVDALNDLKDATGASIENISALERVALLNGSSFDTVSASLIKFNAALGEGLKPGSQADAVLRGLGLSAKELQRLDPAEALRMTAIALSQFADDGNKARATQDLFGKSLREVAPFLKDLAESGRLNGTVTTQQAEAAERFNKELAKMGVYLQDVGRTMAGPMVSGFNSFIEGLRDASKESDSLLLRLAKLPPLTNVFLNALQMAGARGDGPDAFTKARTGIENINIALKDNSLHEGERNALLAERVRLEAKMAGFLNSTAGAGRGMGGYENVPKGSLYLPDIEAEKKAAKTLEEQRKQAEAKAKKDAEDAIRRAMDVAKERQALRNRESEAIAAFQFQQSELERESRKQGRLAVDEYAKAIAQSNEQLALERTLVGASEKDRAIALEQYRIELDLKKQLDALNKNLAIKEAEREELKAKAAIAAGEAKRGAAERVEMEENARRTNALATSIEDGIMNGFRDGKSLADVFLNELKAQFARTILRPQIKIMAQAGDNLMQSVLGAAVNAYAGYSNPVAGGTGFGDYNSSAALAGARADGGPVMGGASYLVGERGPEIFTPGQSGGITPNEKIGGGSKTINYNIRVDARTDQASVVAGIRQALKENNKAVFEELNQRMGG